MKKIISFTLTFLLIIVTFCSCSSNDKKVLNVYNWGEYIDPEVLEQFTEETGIKVIYNLFETNEDMYQKVKTGGSNYDVVFPSDYMIQRMIKDNLLQKVNFDNIPNFKNIEDNFRNLDYDPNNEYSVPYMWGTVGILYNKTMVTDPVDSWDILWNEKYNQQILMQDSVRDVFNVALKKLGYSINSKDKNELNKAKELLIKQKPLVLAYVIDEVRDKMIGNEAALAVIYSGEAEYTRSQNENLDYVIPKEGSNMWFDAMAIPSSAKHKVEAEQFINFMCKPEIAKKNSDYIGYASPNKEAKKLMDKAKIEDERIYPPQEVLDNCEIFEDLGEYNEIYDDLWTQIKSM